MLFFATDEPQFVTVRGPADRRGAYTISAEQPSAEPVELGEPVRGAIDMARPIAVYEFEAPVSGVVSVGVSPSGNLNAVVHVGDSASTWRPRPTVTRTGWPSASRWSSSGV